MSNKDDASYREDAEDSINEEGKSDDNDTSSKKRPAMKISNDDNVNNDNNSDSMIKGRKKMRRQQEIVWQTTERHAFKGPTVDIHTLSGRFGGKESLRKYLPLPEFDCLLGWATHATTQSYHGDSKEPIQTNRIGTIGSRTSDNNNDDDDEEEEGNNDDVNSRNDDKDGNNEDDNGDNRARVTAEALKTSAARSATPNPLIGIQPDGPLPRSYLDSLIHERARALLRGQPPGSAHFKIKSTREEAMQQWESILGQCNTSALVAMGVILEEAMTANLLPLAEYHVRRCRQLEDQEEAHAKAAASKNNSDNSDFLDSATSIDEGSFGQWTLPPEEAIFNVIAHSLTESTCRNHTDSKNNNDTNNQNENINNGMNVSTGTQEDNNEGDQSTLESSGRATENANATSSCRSTEGSRAAENGMEDGLAAENNTMQLISTEADDSDAATKSTEHTGCQLLPTGPQVGEKQTAMENTDKTEESSDTNGLMADTRNSAADKNGQVDNEPTLKSADIEAVNANAGVASTDGTTRIGQESRRGEPTVLELSEENETSMNPRNEEVSLNGKSTDDDDDESDIIEQPRKFITKGLGLLPSACHPTRTMLSPPESETDSDDDASDYDDGDDDDDDKDDKDKIDSPVTKAQKEAEAAASRFCHRQKLEPRAVQRNMDIYQWFLPIAPPLVEVAKPKKAKSDNGRGGKSARSTGAKKKKAVATKKKPAGTGKRKTIVAVGRTKKKQAGTDKTKTTVPVSGTKKKPAGTGKNKTTVPGSHASKEITSGTPAGILRSARNKT